MRLEIKAPYTTVAGEAARILAKEDLALLSIRPVSRETSLAEPAPMNDMSAAETVVEIVKFVAAAGSAYKVLHELAQGLKKILGSDAVKEVNAPPEATNPAKKAELLVEPKSDNKNSEQTGNQR